MKEINHFALKNHGNFAVRPGFCYVDSRGSRICVKGPRVLAPGDTGIITLKDYGIPEGSCLTFYAEVCQGTDREAHQIFIYSEGIPAVAEYVITGTACESTLGLLTPKSSHIA